MGDPTTMPHFIETFEHNMSEYYKNLSWMLNASNGVDNSILTRFATNLKVDAPVLYTLMIAYSCLIFLGSAGNLLVVIAVARKPAMRTARNMFMINLAISDILLCLITMPLTLMEIITQYWPLGRQTFICKLIGTLQAVSVFVSSFSITAIALDRYQVIVYPTRESLQKFGAVAICISIWLAAIVLASPMYVWRTLDHHQINLPSIDLYHITYCIEEWPVVHGRAFYSLFSLMVQFVLPIVTVSIAYLRICRKLKFRYVSQTRKTKDDRRMRRTNSLLVSISVIFCISWLPLNIFNLVVDLNTGNPNINSNSMWFNISYAICHMIGMSSACSNPMLYGWLNDNFRKEFKEILAIMFPCLKIEAVCERVGSLKSSLTKKKKKSNEFAASAAKEETCALANGDEQGGPGISIYQGAAETMTTENGTTTGMMMMHGDTEMTELTRA